ncbi:LysR family transcriptional regulator [Devosia geojensis]|uniref:LysR family transcriptional regulator n=1 Tax=Devosia geojensis TaxID=443610 RepID=A0A0F5FUJ5_9HYPH|nr:LysR family transcriptional regulator [Devosia geojensis]KKB12526.1 LysR family transcriptional regulator [Devosia geojensis]
MRYRAETGDLQAFLAVARELSFTRAAALVGMSQSALSHKIRAMEERLGVRLLERTTRSVAPTEAGLRLMSRIGPRIDEIEAELEALSEFRDRPAGYIRISAGEHSLRTVLWPKIDPFVARYPDIKVEVDVENGLIDIVERGFDAGVRLGEQIAKDMIATRIGPDWRMAIVAAPGYFATRKRPKTPDDLTGHNCINLRLATYGGFYAWEFEKAGRRLNVRVEGQLAFNGSTAMLAAALSGHGLACIPEEMATEHLKSGALVQVLKEWMPTFEGYHLYYPSRQHSAAFQLFVDAVRYRR